MSWKIAAVSGIGLYVHAIFLLVIAWVVLTSWLAEASLATRENLLPEGAVPPL